MNEIISNYLTFLLQTTTIVFAILIILGKIISLKKSSLIDSSDIEIKKLNAKTQESIEKTAKKILNKKDYKKLVKSNKEKQKKHKNTTRSKLFILSFKGDIRASAAEQLREEVSAILAIAKTNDQVLLQLESPGGCVHDYGFAASQLTRIRDHNIKLTVAVDKMAASGGYLMACVANNIIASPFAVIGSIGVLLQVPNFHKFLQDKKINFEQLTSGNDKRNLTVFGENTDEDREKAQEQIDQIHRLFTDFVKKYRPNIESDKVATGKTWHAIDAIELNLVDQITTSDEFIISALKSNDVYTLKKQKKKRSFTQKITESAQLLMSI
ncbi:MAG: protease SohB [Legionellales bacterium]|jgi:serine protease SohB|nr:protease SohB [Legionellales bacterium]